MADIPLLAWLIVPAVFALGYGLGHMHGIISGIRCGDHENRIGRIYGKAENPC